MDIISALLLFTSASFAAVKNGFIKTFHGFSIKNREFFGIQSAIFGAGCIVLFFVNIFDFKGIAPLTVWLALAYGLLLVCAQWFYTIALTKGKTAICATVYSFGFVIPTLSGTLFWDESISIFGYLGILTVIPVLLISGFGAKKEVNSNNSKGFILPLVLALLCSGGLGIVQKIQQKSEYANQKSTLILIAFAFAFLLSLLFFLILKPGEKRLCVRNLGFGACTGVVFSACNLINTYLAGKLDSVIFFPAINVGSILTSLVLGLAIYKERLTKKDLFVLCLGILSIILVNF